VLLAKYFSHDKTKKNRMGATCGTYGVRTDAYRAATKWKTYVYMRDNIKIDLHEIE
jgi:sarcosine oxidase delta subunit